MKYKEKKFSAKISPTVAAQRRTRRPTSDRFCPDYADVKDVTQALFIEEEKNTVLVTETLRTCAAHSDVKTRNS